MRFNTHFVVCWKVSWCTEVIEVYLNDQISVCVVWTDYPWRSAAQPVTSNVIKWFYLPDFAKRPNPSFIFCEFFFTVDAGSSPPVPGVDRLSPQTTTSCCSARPFSGRCLRRRTEQPCGFWLETTWRSAAVWIPVPSTSSSQSITSFTAGHTGGTLGLT